MCRVSTVYVFAIFSLATMPLSDVEEDLTQIGDVPVQSKRLSNNEASSKYEAAPEDIFIVAYPKAGITWMGHMVSQLLNGGHVTKQKKLLSFNLEGVEPMKLMVRPFAILSHFPSQLQPWNPYAKYIIVIRNPKDIAVSRYYSKQTRSGLSASVEEFVQSFLGGRVGFGSYFEWYLSWAPLLRHPNVKLFVYEDMKTNLPEAIADLNKFLGFPSLDKQVLERITHNSSFTKMKELFDGDSRLSPLTRKGMIGDWKTLLNDSQGALFDKNLQESFRNTPFETLWQNHVI
ncbi:Sulfotransferase 1E1 [Halotydeus destructor]|nr:Sulfotransferase 1E1 [Halotydeus destructor]